MEELPNSEADTCSHINRVPNAAHHVRRTGHPQTHRQPGRGEISGSISSIRNDRLFNQLRSYSKVSFSSATILYTTTSTTTTQQCSMYY